jgi:hypothetical protein
MPAFAHADEAAMLPAATAAAISWRACGASMAMQSRARRSPTPRLTKEQFRWQAPSAQHWRELSGPPNSVTCSGLGRARCP